MAEAEKQQQTKVGTTQGVATESTEPQEQLSPKERRRRKRSRHQGEVKPQRSPEERQAERDAERKRKALLRRSLRARQTSERKQNATDITVTEPTLVEQSAGKQKFRQGVVVSSKADKSITVRVDSARRHRQYEKIMRTSKKFYAHDETNEANAGDTVRIIECRPQSRNKRWRLVEIVERAR